MAQSLWRTPYGDFEAGPNVALDAEAFEAGRELARAGETLIYIAGLTFIAFAGATCDLPEPKAVVRSQLAD